MKRWRRQAKGDNKVEKKKEEKCTQNATIGKNCNGRLPSAIAEKRIAAKSPHARQWLGKQLMLYTSCCGNLAPSSLPDLQAQLALPCFRLIMPAICLGTWLKNARAAPRVVPALLALPLISEHYRARGSSSKGHRPKRKRYDESYWDRKKKSKHGNSNE